MQIKDFENLSQYVLSLKKYYRWSEDKFSSVERALTLLDKRIKDKQLYLGIVGEFSSGKSTFINALLGLEVLKEDILPGTTCAPTMLCYSEEFDVEIHHISSSNVIKYSENRTFFSKLRSKCYKNIGLKEKLADQLAEAKDFIYRYTADECFAKDVSKVVLRLPCDNSLFKNGIVIVDTPGINADNKRHQEITEKTIRDLCDLAIVLTPASTPCSQTLLTFIHEHLATFHNYCICLASQIDRVRPRERERQIKYISDRFQSENIQFSQIYPISAACVIHNDGNVSSDAAEAFRDQFNQVIFKICDSLKENKNAVLTDKANSMLEYIVESLLQPMLENTKRNIQERYDKLSKNQLTDFFTFLTKKKQFLQKSFSKYVINKFETDEIANNAASKFVAQLRLEIKQAAYKDDLRMIMQQNNIANYINQLQNGYIKSEISKLQKNIATAAKELLAQLKADFNREFRNLAYYTNMTVSQDKTNMSIHYSLVSNSLNNVAASIDKSEKVTDGLAAAGLIIGSFAIPIPIVGGLIGAGVGFVLNAIFGKSLAEYKVEAVSEIETCAQKWCAELKCKLFSDVMQPYFVQMQERFSEAIDDYKSFYPTIQEVIKNEQTQLEQLKLVIIQTEKDLNYFQELREYLSKIKNFAKSNNGY